MVRLFKLSLKQLGANVNPTGAQRLAQSLGHIEHLLKNVDLDSAVKAGSGHHSSKNLEEVVIQIAKDLKEIDAFRFTEGRCNPTFPAFPQNVLEKLDLTEYYSWVSRLLKVWKAIYEQ